MFQSDARAVLKRLADKAYQTSQERDQLLAQLAAAEGLKAKDLVWMLFRPDRAYRDGCGGTESAPDSAPRNRCKGEFHIGPRGGHRSGGLHRLRALPGDVPFRGRFQPARRIPHRSVRWNRRWKSPPKTWKPNWEVCRKTICTARAWRSTPRGKRSPTATDGRRPRPSAQRPCRKRRSHPMPKFDIECPGCSYHGETLINTTDDDASRKLIKF